MKSDQTSANKPAKLNQKVLERLIERAKETHTDAMLLSQNGTEIGAWYFGKEPQRIETMSMTKSIVSLAVAQLITDKLIESIDLPIWSAFPEWRQGNKEKITIRHILNHTSGLQDEPTTEHIYRSPDFLKLALAAELTAAPGELWFYSNKACNILPGIVKEITGKQIDEYLRTTLFTALEIDDFYWARDSVGNPHGFAGLALKAGDLAKIGQLMLQQGKWNGAQILDKRFIKEAIEPSQKHSKNMGYLWWIDYFGETFFSPKHEENTKASGFAALGYLGQNLIVRPKQKLVAVRQIDSKSYKSDADNFWDFEELVNNLFIAD